MTYQPTKKELEEMNFQYIASLSDGSVLGKYFIDKPMQLPYIEWNPGYDRWFIFSRDNTINIYPKSKSDIECLIRMFNPNN